MLGCVDEALIREGASLPAATQSLVDPHLGEPIDQLQFNAADDRLNHGSDNFQALDSRIEHFLTARNNLVERSPKVPVNSIAPLTEEPAVVAVAACVSVWMLQPPINHAPAPSIGCRLERNLKCPWTVLYFLQMRS